LALRMSPFPFAVGGPEFLDILKDLKTKNTDLDAKVGRAVESLKEATELYLENVELIHNSISIRPFILDCLNNRGTESWNA